MTASAILVHLTGMCGGKGDKKLEMGKKDFRVLRKVLPEHTATGLRLAIPPLHVATRHFLQEECALSCPSTMPAPVPKAADTRL